MLCRSHGVSGPRRRVLQAAAGRPSSGPAAAHLGGRAAVGRQGGGLLGGGALAAGAARGRERQGTQPGSEWQFEPRVHCATPSGKGSALGIVMPPCWRPHAARASCPASQAQARGRASAGAPHRTSASREGRVYFASASPPKSSSEPAVDAATEPCTLGSYADMTGLDSDGGGGRAGRWEVSAEGRGPAGGCGCRRARSGPCIGGAACRPCQRVAQTCCAHRNASAAPGKPAAASRGRTCLPGLRAWWSCCKVFVRGVRCC